MNLDAKTVEVDGAQVHLTGKEYAMLELLSLRKGDADQGDVPQSPLRRHGRARIEDHRRFHLQAPQKLSLACGGDNYIETVWGRGYVLRDAEGDTAATEVAA